MIAAAALFLLSAAILAYEVLLVRLFAIVQWHHLASLAISIALLGFGASGTLLALFQERLRPHFTPLFVAGAALFALLAPASFLAAQALPFNAQALIWEPGQLLYLPALTLLLVLPFFCGATCVGIAFLSLGQRIGGLYACNLIGSAAGALGVVGLLVLLTPAEVLRAIAVLGFLAAALAALGGRGPVWRGVCGGALLLAVAAGVLLPQSWFALRISEFKGLPAALEVEGAEVVAERSGPLGLLTAVESPEVPLRYVPGLSLTAPGAPLPQIALFQDGGGLTAITRYDGRRESLAYLDHTTDALAYHLLERPSVLLLEPGSTAALLQALYHRARRVDLVEPDGNRLALIGQDLVRESGDLLSRPEVESHRTSARGFTAASPDRWDLIQSPHLDDGGLLGLGETYGLTREALRDSLDLLAEDGWLSLTTWLELPPRQSLKLLATAVAALEAAGAAAPEERLLMIRGLTTMTLLVKERAITPREIARAKAFAEARSFDLAFYPGMTAKEANQVNLLDEPYFFEAAAALTGPERAAFLAGYKFDIAPATDERPYFHDLLKWESLPELLAISRAGGGSLVALGEVVLVATLVQAAVLSAVLILLPLWLRRRRLAGGLPLGRVAGYFLALGLGFLLIEIAFIQRFTLFLGHPLTAVAVVLTAFLLFAGLGSAASAGLDRRLVAWRARSGGSRRPSAIQLAAASIVALSLFYLLVLPPLFDALLHLAAAGKLLVALGLIAPLAFAMGIPFPLGLARVWVQARPLVPWAWGVNGCASVLSALLATLIMMEVGNSAAVLAAVLLYAAAATIPWRSRPGT